MSKKPVLSIKKTEKDVQLGRRKAKLSKLAEKKTSGKLTLEDLDDKLDIIIEILQEPSG
jgi:hypothetical protein